MKRRMAFAAVAAAALSIVACGERDGGASPLSTEPKANGRAGASSPEYVTTGSAAVVNPRTHALETVKPSGSRIPGVSASVIASSGTGTLLQIPNGSPGLASGAGFYSMQYVDGYKHQHTIVLLYSLYGGPPAAIQHYVDHGLASTTGFSWQHTSVGWVRKSSLLRVVQNGVLVGTYSTTTTTTTGTTSPGTGSGGGPAIPVREEHQPGATGLQRMLNSMAYGIALALAPQDASAQVSPAFGPCSQEWLRYAAA
ncbi:MAG: hypothetical protein JJD97_07740, partial [Gemmatimonadaceae bacterium]|nr:hypothetical protein [Gemmatimonadaceae bacterium]